jgi:hypothetical protein
MKIISVFEPINKKMFFSPDYYSNSGSTFRLRPRERALVIFTSNSKSNTSTNQYKIKFANNHFYFKYPCYKFMICIQNTSQHRRIICKSGCLLSTLLEHEYVHHYYSNIAIKDLLQARRFQASV